MFEAEFELDSLKNVKNPEVVKGEYFRVITGNKGDLIDWFNIQLPDVKVRIKNWSIVQK